MRYIIVSVPAPTQELLLVQDLDPAMPRSASTALSHDRESGQDSTGRRMNTA
ncbi:MAG: hypothetical protein U1E17_18125 [Geminicoccaceae bacterium]